MSASFPGSSGSGSASSAPHGTSGIVASLSWLRGEFVTMAAAAAAAATAAVPIAGTKGMCLAGSLCVAEVATATPVLLELMAFAVDVWPWRQLRGEPSARTAGKPRAGFSCCRNGSRVLCAAF